MSDESKNLNDETRTEEEARQARYRAFVAAMEHAKSAAVDTSQTQMGGPTQA